MNKQSLMGRTLTYSPFLLLLFLPHLAHAAESSGALNFKPPAQDVSVIFLSNIFGVVDGVLSGTGSQIVGQMFGVFNAAVLALGGIILLYTMLVATMNTAGEGEVLGRKWSSIWVPVRSTIGIGLLLPKASGYCMMQIFIMWVIVQGVGAADKVWDAALSYLNRGGVIITANVKPSTATSKQGPVLEGAKGILTAQVCMLGLQNKLSQLRSLAWSRQAGSDFSCNKDKKHKGPTGAMKKFCNKEVPDFINSSDLTDKDSSGEDILNLPSSTKDSQGNTQVTVVNVNFPQFDSSQFPYNQLNGICGNISWNSVDTKSKSSNFAAMGINKSEQSQMKNSRAIAMQQMYIALSSVAQSMVSNDSQLNTSFTCKTSSSDTNSSHVECINSHARYAFGVPMTGNQTQCDGSDCLFWGTLNNSSSNVLFAGNELQNAVLAYTGIMAPTLAALSQSSTSGDAGKAAAAAWNASTGSSGENFGVFSGKSGVDDVANEFMDGYGSASQYSKAAIYKRSHAFINKSKAEGWILAGSYFFFLARLNDAYQGTELDSHSGIVFNIGYSSSATEPISTLQKALKGGDGSRHKCSNTGTITNDGGVATSTSTPLFYCGASKANELAGVGDDVTTLIAGSGSSAKGNGMPQGTQFEKPTYVSTDKGGPAVRDPNSVFGYINNSLTIRLPGQAGQKAPHFVMNFNFKANNQVPELPSASFSGGMFGIPGKVVSILYNGVVRTVFNTLLAIVFPIVNQLFFLLVSPPILLLTGTFNAAIKTLSNPLVNPIVALANMGSTYINGAATMWVQMGAAAAGAMAVGTAGIGILALIAPIVMLWLGVMVGVGFITAYYTPFVPYMLFTFGAFAWFIAVIEAMVAAPIVALGVTHPEGHDAFGKAEQAMNLLLNVFLRPALMILGYIFGIILCYVGVWMMNAGFQRTLDGIQNMGLAGGGSLLGTAATSAITSAAYVASGASLLAGGTAKTPYNQWTGLFFYFFSLLVYTTMYIAIIQKAFSLIHYLPDKVLRWMGGGVEQLGESMASGAQDVKQGVEKGAQASSQGIGQMNKQMGKHVNDALGQQGQDPSSEATEQPEGTESSEDPSGGGGEASGGGTPPPPPPA